MRYCRVDDAIAIIKVCFKMYKLRNYEESQAWLKGFKLMYFLKFNFFPIFLKSNFDSFLDFLGLNFERTLFVFHIGLLLF